MNRRLIIIFVLLLMLSGCATAPEEPEESREIAPLYRQISQEEAHELMESGDGCIILDVRTVQEYEQAHIPGAVCVPNESIKDTPPAELPDTDATILVYCRTGIRSKDAAEKLANMVYTDVREFGGIMSWVYGTEY